MERRKGSEFITYYDEIEKHQIISKYLKSGQNKADFWFQYTGKEDHGVLLGWMRKLGYLKGVQLEERPLKGSIAHMPKGKNIQERKEESFETLQLKKRISELEKQLKDAEMKAIAFSTMVDIAEEEFKIPIRKKLNTKP
jgi:transposase